jgi:hypothetical protein
MTIAFIIDLELVARYHELLLSVVIALLVTTTIALIIAHDLVARYHELLPSVLIA